MSSHSWVAHIINPIKWLGLFDLKYSNSFQYVKMAKYSHIALRDLDSVQYFHMFIEYEPLPEIYRG